MNLLFLLAIMALALALAFTLHTLHAPRSRPRPRSRPPFPHGRTWGKQFTLWGSLGWRKLKAWGSESDCQFANIGEGTFENGVRSYIADAVTTSRYLMYKRGTDADHCAVTGAGDDPLGSSDDQADDTVVPIAINLFGCKSGTLRVVTDGTISDGDYCKCAASGKATKASTGDLCFGRALIPTDSSKANGDVIQVIHEMPSKLTF